MKKRSLSFWSVVAAAIFGGGLVATVVRFGKGLSASTDLTDAFPWGIWVGFDLLVGIGVTAGGFVVAATVHIFDIKKYAPIVRPAILTAFLGYFLEAVALMYDLGRPLRLWHPLIMWNPRSPLFVVAWCVMLYTAILALEFSPAVFERFKLKVPLRLIRAIYLPVVIVGVLISTLHQSLLGTLYVIVPDKIHPLWYSPSLPILFFLSSVGAGPAMTIIESYLSSQAFGRRLEKDVLEGLGRVVAVVLGVYLVFRVQDLFLRGGLPLVFRPERESVMFGLELGLGVFLPMVLLLISRVRRNESGLFLAALLAVFGFVVNRLNVSITGMVHSEAYFPKWTEIMISLFMVTVGFVVFSLAVRYSSVFPEEEPAGPTEGRSVFAGPAVIGAWGVLLIGATLFVYGNRFLERRRPPGPAPVATSVIKRSPAPLDSLFVRLPRPLAYPMQRKSPGVVVFRHKTHLDPAEAPDCGICHEKMFGILRDGVVDLKAVDKESMKKGGNCGACHDGKQAFGLKRHCMACHER